MSWPIRVAFVFLSIHCLAEGHVGSPDIYLDGRAGPYQLFVTIRPPQVIPGVAEILVRSKSPGVTAMQAVPLPLSGVGADHPPVPDALTRSSSDPQFFSGSLWLMTDGSWQVRIFANGSTGAGTLSIPVPAVARSIRRMDWLTSLALSVIGLLLVGSLAAICGATVREAKLNGGETANEGNRQRGRVAVWVALGVIALVLAGGKAWWDSESETFRQRIYKPLNMQADLLTGSDLLLKLSEPGWMQARSSTSGSRLTRVLFVRKMDDFVLDHDHLMHLYLIREPGFDVIYHLHPDQTQPDQFRLSLPAMPPGHYKLYADVVHGNGLAETLTSSLELKAGAEQTGPRPLSGDDAQLKTQPVGDAALGSTFVLPDGYRMRWLHNSAALKAREGREFAFELLTPNGLAPTDMQLYMGMLGHAAFVKTDGTVFAHIHPNGTVAMSAFMMAQGEDNMAGMNHMQRNETIPNQVAFPYGLPSAGKYRIFVQMKHGGTIETGAFDVVAQ